MRFIGIMMFAVAALSCAPGLAQILPGSVSSGAPTGVRPEVAAQLSANTSTYTARSAPRMESASI